MTAQHGILVVALPEGVAILDPLLLNELELPGDAGIEREEHQSAAAVFGFASLPFWAIGDATSNQPVAVDEPAVEPQAVARIGPSDMRAEWAVRTFGITPVAEVAG